MNQEYAAKILRDIENKSYEEIEVYGLCLAKSAVRYLVFMNDQRKTPDLILREQLIKIGKIINEYP